MKQIRSKLIVLCICISLLGFSLLCYFKPVDTYSDSERRPLNTVPSFTLENVLSAEFMNEFESYALDQFPMRDTFRKVKAFFNYYIFQHSDNNKIIYKDGHVSKLEYPLHKVMLENAQNKFCALYEQYLKDTNVHIYFSIIPDKNYYLIENDYITMDYQKLVMDMKNGTSYMKYIDLFSILELNDYYYTDTHWKQENIVDVAKKLKEVMLGKSLDTSYEMNVIKDEKGDIYPFYGVYAGQYALDVKPEKLVYLTNDILNTCEVYSYSSGQAKAIDMYSMNKAYGKDGYEMFLNGSEALLTIVNPNASTTKELVIFRDSFGSSLAPLLVDAYAKVTLVDIRYMDRSQIGNFVDFTDQDVLFLYSTILLNNSSAFK